MSSPGLRSCSRPELAVLVREYLLAGHLIDRAGMPYLIAELGREAMRDIAIEEWMGASPVYTRRIQRALGFEGDSVETIFKAMQFDIGAPPQFMDFRYRVHDHDRGEFWLDHCGALLDVEPLGDDYVVAMCHDIEDPTFDATAVATNPRAQVRPVHRPPRVPADRTPMCHWTVVISEDHEALGLPAQADAIAATRAATLELDPVDADDEGRGDYRGPLLSDVRFEDWSRSALVRIAEEVCLQGQLLALAFLDAVRRRVGTDAATSFSRRQLTGSAGLAAQRLVRALDLGSDLDAVARLLELHPALLPGRYTGIRVDRSGGLVIRLDAGAPGMADGGWPSLLDAEHLDPLDAVVRAVDPRYRCTAVDAGGDGLAVEVVMDDAGAPVAEEVVLARYSKGADFAFEDRGTPVEVRPG